MRRVPDVEMPTDPGRHIEMRTLNAHWRLRHPFRLALLILVAEAFFFVSPSSGQIRRTVGFHLGQVRSHQIWSGPISTETADGVTLGVNVDVPTPISFLSIRAEIGYVGRGSVVWDQGLDPHGLVASNVRSHYLSIPIQGKVRVRLGPASAYVFAGPSIDQLLETQCTEDLCRVLSEERPTVFNVTAGSGVSFDYRNRFRGDVEFRLTEGLTDAYLSPSSGVRYRSMEFLLRASLPF
ncbi:MAG: PorT family protein [Gemmatimonadales bacterium]|nr:MAG: PorT family protein [Gemmatimonadales bacterium]